MHMLRHQDLIYAIRLWHSLCKIAGTVGICMWCVRLTVVKHLWRWIHPSALRSALRNVRHEPRCGDQLPLAGAGSLICFSRHIVPWVNVSQRAAGAGGIAAVYALIVHVVHSYAPLILGNRTA